MNLPTRKVDTTAAQAYEDHLAHTLFGPWAERVVDMAAPCAGETVLDVACGTGLGARLVAPLIVPGGRVISADNDPAMIAVAEATAKAAGLPGDVAFEWRAAPAEDAVAPDGSVDLCLCMQGPQFVTDPAAAMARNFAALKPGGRIAASMWNEYPTATGHYAIGQALIARGLKPALKPFSLGNPDTARALFTDAGFEVEDFATAHLTIPFPSVRAFVDGVAAGAPATRHALAQLAPADFAAFIADVEGLLDAHVTETGVALPTSAHLVLARKPL